MNNDELIASLADTLANTRFEIDAMRVLLQASLQTIAEQPSMVATLVGRLQGCIDADEAIMLNTHLSDQALKARSDWLSRLMPQQILPMLRLP